MNNDAKNLKDMAKAIGMEVNDNIVNQALKDEIPTNVMRDNTLTDEEINELAEKMEENRDKTLMERTDPEKFEQYQKELEEKGLQEGISTIMVNNGNGAGMVVSTDNDEESEPQEEIDLVKIFDQEKDEITLEKCITTFEDIYDIKDKAFQEKLYNLIMDVDNATYDELPDNLKFMVKNAAGSSDEDNKEKLDELAKELLTNMKTDIVAQKTIVDLNQVIADTQFKSGKILDEINDYNRHRFEVESLEQAAKLREQGIMLKQAKILEQFPQAYRNSYTYEPLRRKWTTLKIKGKRVNIKKYLDKEVKFYQKYVMEFDNRYRQIEFSINSCSLILKPLQRFLPDISEINLKKFIVLFCMVCKVQCDPKNVIDHIFMYYTIQNIISLDAIQDKTVSIPAEMNKNIRAIINDIIL